MDEHLQRLKEYISQQRRAGVAPEIIHKTLVQHGWDAQMVSQAIAEADSPQLPSVELPTSYQPDIAGANDSQSPAKPLTQIDSAVASVDAPADADSVPKPTPKYKVFVALADTVTAIRRNAVAYFGTAIIALVVALILMGIIGGLIGGAIISLLGSGGLGNSFVSLIILGIILYVFSLVLISLIQTVTNLTVNDGADGRKSNIKNILKTTPKKLPRLLLANLLVWLVAVGPLFLAAIFSILVALAQRSSGGLGSSNTGFVILLLVLAVAASWVLLAILRYALAPYVAMFEPDVPLLKTLQRSRSLLNNGGKWFLFKGMLLLLLAVIIISAVSGQNVQELQNSSNFLINITFIALEILLNGALVMLYRNRLMVKGQGEADSTAKRPAILERLHMLILPGRQSKG